MAKRMETRSARILALFLALIMIGSVITYVFKGSENTSERNVRFEMGKFPDTLNFLPNGAQFVLYLNFSNLEKESDLYELLNDVFKSQIDPFTFKHLALSKNIESVVIAKYPYPLYFVNVNKSKVYFSYEGKEVYKGYTIKLRQGVALIDEISPFVIGYPTFVYSVVDLLQDNNSVGSFVSNYTQRIYDFAKPSSNFNYALILYGESAKTQLVSDNESIGDFYFVAYRMNGSVYEKIEAIHFTKNGFFVSSNETENATAYYYYKNFDDGLSVVKMGSEDLEKLMLLKPEMRIVKIKIKE